MYRIYLLGPFHLEESKGKLLSLAYQNAQWVLAYLLLHKEDWHRREALASKFWPETEKSGNNFRNALHAIRSVLKPIDAEKCFLSKPGMIKWNPNYPFWLDTESFEDLLGETQRLSGEAKVGYLREAADLYRGNLLEGGGFDWIEPIRSYYERRYVSALDELTDYFQEIHEYQTAIDHAEWIRAKRPYQDEIHYKLMRLHLANKDRVAAIHVYEAFVDLLKQDLGKDYRPEKKLTDLYIEIVRGSAAISDPPEPIDPIELGSPFVNREAETQHFLRVWGKVRQSEGQTLILSGEAGIGKSRLAQEYERYARNEGALVFRSRCYEQEQALPYAPLTDALHRMVSADGVDWECVPKVALSDVIKLMPEIQTQVPEIEPSPPLATPEQEQNRLLSSCCEVFGALAENQIVVLFLDDVAWADDATFSVLHRLIRRGAQSRLLLLFTYREGDVPKDHMLWHMIEELQPDHAIHNQILLPLERDYIHEMALGILKHIEDDDLDELWKKVLLNAGGNAFFIEELIRFLVDESFIRKDPKGKWKMQLEAFSDELIPDNVQRVILNRLRRLTHDGRQLLEALAVLGNSFNATFLTRLLGPWQKEWLRSLDNLLWSCFLEEIDGKYQFHHKMIQETVYQSLSTATRQHWHLRIAEFYTELIDEDETAIDFLGEAAFHYEKSHQYKNAIKFYLQAGWQSWKSRYAKTEALHFFSRSLCLAKSEDDVTSIGQSYRGLGEVCSFTDQYEEGLRYNQQALESCKQPNDRAEIFIAIANIYHVQRELEEGLSYCKKSLKELATENQPSIKIKAYYYASTFLNWLLRYDDAIKNCKEALKLLEINPEDNLESLILAELGFAWSGKGEFDKAKEYLYRSEDLANKTGDLYSIVQSFFKLALALYQAKEVDQAIEAWKKSLVVLEELNDPDAHVGICNKLTYAYLYKNEHEKALDFAQEQLKYSHATSSLANIGMAHGMLACLYEAKGDLKNSEKYFEKALEANEHSIMYLNIIVTYLYLENLDQAINWAKKGKSYLKERHIDFLKSSPSETSTFILLRRDSRFKSLFK